MKKIFFCLLLVNFQNLNAQSLKWFEGSLVLSSCEVLIGEIALEPEHDLIVFQQGESRMVYPAHRIKFLYFYDPEANINRRYVSLKLSDNVRKSFQLYEIVITGEVSVLRRKKATAFSIHADPLDYNYYVQYNDMLTPLRKFNRKVYSQLLASSDKRLQDFITLNSLSENLPANAIRIIQFYNTLVKSGETLASRN